MKQLLSLFMIALFTNFAAAQSPTPAQLSPSDQLLASVQGICPVMGEKLGAMGDLIKIQVEGETAFLCCEDCMGKAINPEHWKTIQANMAKAQGICPVMKRELPENASSTVVNGRRIFVCCPPCSKKIAADPATFTAMVDEKYTAYVAATAAHEAVHLRITAQKICPVSGNELGSMGEPVSVKTAEGEEVFLCCKGCEGKAADANHWASIQSNLRAAQGKCPVMDKALTENAKSVVVNGRRVFICCPGCEKKLAADPRTFLSKVDQLYAANVHSGHHAEAHAEPHGHGHDK